MEGRAVSPSSDAKEVPLNQPIRSAVVAMALGLGVPPALAAGAAAPAMPGATTRHARQVLRHLRATHTARPTPPRG